MAQLTLEVVAWRLHRATFYDCFIHLFIGTDESRTTVAVILQ